MNKLVIFVLLIGLILVVTGCHKGETPGNLNSMTTNIPSTDQNGHDILNEPNSSTAATPDSLNSENFTVNISGLAGDVPVVNIIFQKTSYDIPEKIQVYSLLKPEISLEYVKNLGQHLGLKGEVQKRKDGTLFIGDVSAGRFLSVFPATGGIQYGVESKVDSGEVSLPSEEEALKIATEYLKEMGLLIDGVEPNAVRPGATEKGVTTQHSVSFAHDISGIPFFGPGCKYTVHVGDQGEIVYMIINPVKYQPYKLVETISIDEALKIIQSERKYSAPGDARTVEIVDISLAYWLEPINKGQDFIVPVFIFRGVCEDSQGKELKEGFMGITKAVN